jgi:predicted porin
MTIATPEIRARGLSAVCCAALVLSVAGAARAELTLYDKDGWTVKHDGLAQGFYHLGLGDAAPVGGSAPPVRFDFLGSYPADDATSNHFLGSRFRSGWTGGRFNWRITNHWSETTRVSAYLGVAYSISTHNAPPATNANWDIRNGFVQIESTWGDLIIGRGVGLYTLGSIISTIDVTSARLGFGHACGLDGDGLGCYTTGYGVKFPGFWAGAFYTTPDLGGLRIKVAALDPVKLGANQTVGGMMGAPAISQEWARTPLPAFQVLALYEAAFGTVKIKPFFNGYWQRVGRAGAPDTLDPMGGGAGLDLHVGPVKLGAGGTLEKGTTMYVPLFGAEIIDGNGQLRSGNSFYVHGLVTLGPVDVNAGFGQAALEQSTFDQMNGININKNQRNIYAGLQYHVGPLTWVAEIALLHHTWYAGNTMDVTFASLGASFVY